MAATAPSALAGTGLLAIGDFGVGGERQRRLGAAVRAYEASHPARILVALGDNDYTGSPQRFAANWRASFGWTARAGLQIAGALGNHDVRVDRGRYEFELLGMPRRYYARRVGPVELFVLDSTRVDRGQMEWLQRALRRSSAEWKVAVTHHPPFTCGGYRSHPGVLHALTPAFNLYGVRLVLSGHDHNYQRFAPLNGVTYVVHGGGGASLYRLRRCPALYPRRLSARRVHGFLHLEADSDQLVVRSVSLSGRIVDRFTLRRPVTFEAPGGVQRP